MTDKGKLFWLPGQAGEWAKELLKVLANPVTQLFVLDALWILAPQ